MYVISYMGPNFNHVKAVTVADEAQADAYIATFPETEENRGLVTIKVTALENLKHLSWSVLGTLYNGLATEPVKKFDSAEVARGRLFALLERAAKPWDASQVSEANSGSDKPKAEKSAKVAKVDDFVYEMQPGDETLTEEELAAKKKAAKKAAKKGTRKKGAGTGVSRPRVTGDDNKIKILSKDNPHREGSDGAKLWDKISSGMTIGEALKKGLSRSNLRRWKRKGYIDIK